MVCRLKLLLTGGHGMVGKNLLEHPEINKVNVLAPSSKELNLFNVNQVEEYLKKHSPDIVIHAAGKVGGIQANLREPVNYLLKNLDMGRNIIFASRRAGIKKFINLGSSCMYPRNHEESLKEEMILKGELEPTNEGYALAKIVTAKLCQYIARENPEYQYKTLIPCNLYGRHDKFDPANSHLIPAIIHKVYLAVQNGTRDVEIWGDGIARREFMYAGDFADVLMQAIFKFDTLPSMMNVGNGYDYSINQYYSAVADVLGYEGSFFYDLTKPVGMARKLVNVERQAAWGWKSHTNLNEGIRKTFNFYRESRKYES
jgi:GDP-L-fucose synthase